MVMSRSRRPKRNEAALAVDITPTVAEAERLLEEARRAEAERAAEMARQCEDAARRRAEFARDAAALVTATESRVQAVVTETSDANVVPSRELRTLARAWLHGFAAPYGRDLMTQEDVIAVKDPTAAMLLDAAREAGEIYERLTDVDAHVSLDANHPLARRVDAVEVLAWRTFVGHVTTLAGE
jgi:hypothetical protein